MIRIAAGLVFCLISLGALAQTAAPQFDCTPICGSPTCCIARSQTIPACSVSNSSAISTLQRLAARDKSAEIINICLGATKTRGVNPIADKSQAEALRRLSCRWGCCRNNQVLAMLQGNPKLGEKMFAGTALAAVGREISDKGALTPAAQSRIDGELTARRIRICIFCCTF